MRKELKEELKEIAKVGLCLFIGCGISFLIANGIKIDNRIEDSRMFTAWTKCTGNPDNLTSEEFNILRRHKMIIVNYHCMFGSNIFDMNPYNE